MISIRKIRNERKFQRQLRKHDGILKRMKRFNWLVREYDKLDPESEEAQAIKAEGLRFKKDIRHD